MTTHYEYDQSASSPFATLKQLDEGPLLKEVTKGYQLDMQCTLSLEHLISQEKFQPEGLEDYEPENAREWSFRDQVRRVIKELVTVKNHYFSTLTQALALLQKQEQKISFKAALLEFHNKMNSHKDMQIEALKGIVKALGFDPESREIPSHQRIKDLQSRMSSVTREDVMTKIQQVNKLQLSKKDSKSSKENIDNRFSQQTRSNSAHKSRKDQPMTLQQGSNIIRKVLNTTTNRSRENSTDQRRSSVSRKENGLPQEFSSTAQRAKEISATQKTVADRKPFINGIATSSFAQDIKKILAIRKTPKSPLKPVSSSILNSQRSQRTLSRTDVFENLRIESTELPRGVRVVSKTSQNASRLTTQRSIERHNTDFPCQERMPVSQRSASLSRSPDSTPNMTLQSSRVHTGEEVNMVNKKDRTDVQALQKSLKKSCKKLMQKKANRKQYRDPVDPISCEDQRVECLSHQEVPLADLREENPRQRRSKSIGSVPAGIYEVEDITECRIKPVIEKRYSDSPVKDMSPRALIEKQIEAFKKNYDSQSSIGGSLLHDINSISYCNQMDIQLAHKDQENANKKQSKPKKLPIQAFGLKDITKTLNSRGNLSARGGSGYVIHTERSPMRDEEKIDFLQRRRSVGKSTDNAKMEVMYGTKTLKKVKNWAPLLTKKY